MKKKLLEYKLDLEAIKLVKTTFKMEDPKNHIDLAFQTLMPECHKEERMGKFLLDPLRLNKYKICLTIQTKQLNRQNKNSGNLCTISQRLQTVNILSREAHMNLTMAQFM